MCVTSLILCISITVSWKSGLQCVGNGIENETLKIEQSGLATYHFVRSFRGLHWPKTSIQENESTGLRICIFCRYFDFSKPISMKAYA